MINNDEATDQWSRLKKLIEDKKATIAVIGLGYVGLPLAVKFVEAGFTVRGVEVNESVVNALREGKSHVVDISNETITSCLNLGLTINDVQEDFPTTNETTQNRIAEADIYLICVPTPLDHADGCGPFLDHLQRAAEIVAHSLIIQINRRQQTSKLVVVESTTYPSATESVITNALASMADLVKVAYSPERTNPGGGRCFTTIPKVIGGQDDSARDLAAALYLHIMKDAIVTVDSMREAETVKCVENTFRFVAISFANSLARAWHFPSTRLWDLLSSEAYRNLGLRTIIPVRWTENTVSPAEALTQVIQHNGLESRNVLEAPVSIDYWVRQCIDELGAAAKQTGTVEDIPATEVIAGCYRALTVQLLWQLQRYCQSDALNVPLQSVMRAVLTKPFGLNTGLPGPGVGGHCIPIDPLYLFW